MNSNLPVIGGTYADLRQVKSRGVWQLVVDVPAEDAEKLVDLFGLPRQDEPTWLAIARLTNPPEAKATQGSVAKVDPPSTVPGGAKRERTLPEKVGMRCGDAGFINWLAHDHKAHELLRDGEELPEWAARVIRQRCGVESRKEILPGTEAATKWLALETRFLEATGQMAERR